VALRRSQTKACGNRSFESGAGRNSMRENTLQCVGPLNAHSKTRRGAGVLPKPIGADHSQNRLLTQANPVYLSRINSHFAFPQILRSEQFEQLRPKSVPSGGKEQLPIPPARAPQRFQRKAEDRDRLREPDPSAMPLEYAKGRHSLCCSSSNCERDARQQAPVVATLYPRT
jgi:hypothetical protein